MRDVRLIEIACACACVDLNKRIMYHCDICVVGVVWFVKVACVRSVAIVRSFARDSEDFIFGQVEFCSVTLCATSECERESKGQVVLLRVVFRV